MLFQLFKGEEFVCKQIFDTRGILSRGGGMFVMPALLFFLIPLLRTFTSICYTRTLYPLIVLSASLVAIWPQRPRQELDRD